MTLKEQKIYRISVRRIAVMAFLLCSFVLGLNAQVQVEQKIDSVQILIGQQTGLHLTVNMKKGQKAVLPEFKRAQMITPGVEVVSWKDGDTTDIDNDMIQVSRTYQLTSFDEKVYAIPALNVKVGGRNYCGNQLALKVLTVDVDTLHPNQFFPPKDVQNNPFDWGEWSPYFWLSILLLLICVVMTYLVYRLKQNKPIITHIRIVKHIPAHQKALKEIDQIKADHLVQSEDQKAYYTKLTETLRKYIQERFGFNAMEMTSSEIIAALQEKGDKKMIDELHDIFFTADLVKFAKYSTLINENDLNLVNAVNFIDQTKQDEKPTEERIVPKLSEDDKKSRNNRITIKSLICVGVVGAVALLVYIIYNIFMLLF